jgi:sarcosine oxidase subunit alpha
VILLEARPWLGGAFEYRAAAGPSGQPLFKSARELARDVERAVGIRIFTHAPVVGVYTDGQVTAIQHGGAEQGFEERYIEIRAKSVVAATGCIERPLLFENNERPGIMQTECALRLARTWGILPGSEAVFSIGHDQGLEAAVDLCDLGLKVAVVVDVREDGQDPRLLEALAQRRIPFLKGWVAQKAHGGRQISSVTLSSLNGHFNRELPCDLLVASAGLTPVTGPLTLAEAILAYDNRTGFFLPKETPAWLHAAGRLLGLNAFEAIAASGRLAGLKAARGCGIDVGAGIRNCERELKDLPGPARGSKFVSAPRAGKKAFVCFDEDTTLKNVDQAMDMGFDVPELIKRFTSAGTGPGQGGIPGHNLPLYVSQSGSSPDPQPRPTLTRPPLVPTLLAAYAGASHAIFKRTPLHTLQKADGGRMETVGDWKRARRFSDDTRCRAYI